MRKVIVGMLLLAGLASGCRDEEMHVYPRPSPEVPSHTPTLELTGDSDDSFQAGAIEHLRFRILFPLHYDASHRYPLHIFLHGVGERGFDNEQQLKIGGRHFLADSIRGRYPAFVVYPQCPVDQYWFNKDIVRELRALITALMTALPVDEKSVSIGGFSMGAYGTFAMVAAYPELFSAAAAISGEGEPTLAPLMSKPVWQLFAGSRDEVVPSARVAQMATALKIAGANVTFTLYPSAHHGNTWQYAFREAAFYERLFNAGSPQSDHRTQTTTSPGVTAPD